jgi:hypothetical protein
VHPRLVDVATRAVPRAATARDGQRHRARVPDRELDVIYLQRRARALLGRHVRRHAHAQEDEKLGGHPRGSHAFPKEQHVEPAEPGASGGDVPLTQPRGQGDRGRILEAVL